MPFIFWINKAVKLIKAYCRTLGYKTSSLNLYDTIEEPEEVQNQFEMETNYETLLKLNKQLELVGFVFFKQTEEGKLIKEILDATQA